MNPGREHDPDRAGGWPRQPSERHADKAEHGTSASQSSGLRGRIAHVAIPEGGNPVCRCGDVGCLEAVADGAAQSGDGDHRRVAARRDLVMSHRA